MIEKSTVIATDTTIVSRVADKDSTSLKAKIDSIIVEEYYNDDMVSSYRKGNDTSQKETGSLKKKTKIYGVNLSGTWLSTNDSLNNKMTHQATTKSKIKQKTPKQTNAGGKIVFALIGFAIALFVGYVLWKNAVQ